MSGVIKILLAILTVYYYIIIKVHKGSTNNCMV